MKPFRYERADCCSHVPACAVAYMGLFVFVCSALRIIFSEARRPEPSGLRPGGSLSIGVSLQKQLFSFFISFLLPWRSEMKRMQISPFSSLICAVRRCVAAPGLRSSDLCPAAEARYCIIST